ncbi:related to MFS phospholipid transporter (Git1) [Zygosaccharomyces bailii]|nr:related to MFS phospholipid transporter (Git1) [Zygosaccharomyces bailii]
MSSVPKYLSKAALRDVPLNAEEWRYRLWGQSRKEIRWLHRRDVRHVEQQQQQHEPQDVQEIAEQWKEVQGEVQVEELQEGKQDSLLEREEEEGQDQEDAEKVKSPNGLRKYGAILTTGAGLFSDGYINTSISTVSACLKRVYKDEYSNSNAMQNVSSIAFAGTVVGQLFFGWFADYHSRKVSMVIGTSIIIVFSILCAGAWGVGTTSTHAGGLFTAITAYRFFLGLGIGSEYSSGSPAAAEAANLLPPGKRNRYFCWFTNLMLDAGGVVASFTALVVLWICGTNHLNTVWRVTLGIGAIPPMTLFVLRLFYRESEEFTKNKFHRRMPYWRIIKFYWFRVLTTSTIWFLYDFSSYAFNTYSTLLIQIVMGKDDSMYKSFGWNVVFTLFNVPGSLVGSVCADWWGPRITLTSGLIVQAAIGYAMAGCLESLKKHVAGFVVIYGIFTTCGEFAAGDNIGLLCATTVASPVRGHLYGISAAIGKVGAFVGTYVFPDIIKNAGGSDTTSGLQAPYWCSSTLCVFSALVAYLCLPDTDQNASLEEDERFIEYLRSTGYDVSQLGDAESEYEVERVAVDIDSKDKVSNDEQR